MRKIVTKDGVSLAVYSFGGVKVNSTVSQSASFPKLLFSHANGFHGRIYQTTIASLTEVGYDCWSMDHRGHGQSTCILPHQLNWNIFGDDILTVTKEITSEEEKIVGVGHSFGAAAFLMAALQSPEKFSHLVLYEPVLFPWYYRFISRFYESPLAIAAMKRRRSFPSVAGAIENFKSKQPMKSFHPSVLHDYCTYGMHQLEKIKADNEDGEQQQEWTLSCPPENEAAIFRSGALHTTMDQLHSLKVPVLMITGRFESQGLSRFVSNAAKKIPNCEFVCWDDLGHLGPMEDPLRFARAVKEYKP
jgi:pimeloyl-ACP methyl ester carboxylesterase